MSNIIKAGILYFLIVFGLGFLLGFARVVFLVPVTGERYAELTEMPLMLVAVYFMARYIVRRFSDTPNHTGYLFAGIISLFLMLLAELTLVLGLRGITLTEYFSTRDAVAGSFYSVSLIIFTIMPYLLSKYGSIQN